MHCRGVDPRFCGKVTKTVCVGGGGGGVGGGGGGRFKAQSQGHTLQFPTSLCSLDIRQKSPGMVLIARGILACTNVRTIFSVAVLYLFTVSTDLP